MVKKILPESYYMYSTTKQASTSKRVKFFKVVEGKQEQYQLIKLDGVYYLPVESGDQISIEIENRTSDDLGLMVRIQSQNICLTGTFNERANYENGLIELKSKSSVTVDSYINNALDRNPVSPLIIKPEYLGFPISLFTKHVKGPKENDGYDDLGDPLWVEYDHRSRPLFSIRMVTQTQIDSMIQTLNK
jgi:hypothetical protein